MTKEKTLEQLEETLQSLQQFGAFIFEKEGRTTGKVTTMEYVEKYIQDEIDKIEKENQCPFCKEPGLVMTSKNLDKVCKEHKPRAERSTKTNEMFHKILKNVNSN